MQKAKLTKENIETDIQKHFKSSYKDFLHRSLICFVLLIVILVLLLLSGSSLGILIEIKTFIASVAVICYTIIVGKNLKQFSDALKNEHQIKTDILVSSEYSDRVRTTLMYAHDHYYILQFSEHGKYIVPQENYTWHNDWKMSCRGVYNTSVKDDEFYLVLSNKGKILYAYNKKFFELEE